MWDVELAKISSECSAEDSPRDLADSNPPLNDQAERNNNPPSRQLVSAHCPQDSYAGDLHRVTDERQECATAECDRPSPQLEQSNQHGQR